MRDKNEFGISQTKLRKAGCIDFFVLGLSKLLEELSEREFERYRENVRWRVRMRKLSLDEY